MRRTRVVTMIMSTLLAVGAGLAPAATAHPTAWSAPEDLTPELRRLNMFPVVIGNDAGQVVAAWWHDKSRRDDQRRGATIGVRDPGAAAWTVRHELLSPRQKRLSTVRLVRLADDRVAAVWTTEHTRTGARQLRLGVVEADGSLRTARPMDLPAGPVGFELDVSATASGGVLAALSDGRHEVVVARGERGRWRSADLPGLPTSVTLSRVHQAVPDGDDGVTLLVKDDERGELLALSAEAGDTEWSVHTLAVAPWSVIGQDQFPSAAGIGGDVAIGWRQAPPDGLLMVATRLDGVWDVRPMAATSNCTGPFAECMDLGMAADGEVVVVWHRAQVGTGLSEAVLSRRDPATGAWSVPELLFSDIDDDEWDSRNADGITVDPSGDAAISWEDTDNHRAVLRCPAAAACEHVGDPVVDHPWDAAFAVSGDGTVTAVWQSEFWLRWPATIRASTYG